jgi:hypothetical protein
LADEGGFAESGGCGYEGERPAKAQPFVKAREQARPWHSVWPARGRLQLCREEGAGHGV